MNITFFLLFQVVVSIGLVIYRDYLKRNTEELDDLTWDACVHPGRER